MSRKSRSFCGMERMEPRRLFAYSVVTTPTTIGIVGGNGNDTLNVSISNDDGLLTLPNGSLIAYDGSISVNGTKVVYNINVDRNGDNIPDKSIYVNGGGGHDTVNLTGDASLAGPVVLYGGNGNDNINASIFSGNVIVYGGAGNDTIMGSAGDDSLYGEGGTDILNGGGGVDVLLQ